MCFHRFFEECGFFLVDLIGHGSLPGGAGWRSWSPATSGRCRQCRCGTVRGQQGHGNPISTTLPPFRIERYASKPGIYRVQCRIRQSHGDCIAIPRYRIQEEIKHVSDIGGLRCRSVQTSRNWAESRTEGFPEPTGSSRLAEVYLEKNTERAFFAD